MAKVPLAHGISTSRSMNFELGFGVCPEPEKRAFLHVFERSLSRLRNESKKVTLEVAHIPTLHEKVSLGAWRGV